MPTLVIAHRGASAHERENTLTAFVAAGAYGADWVELDVRPTADRALAVHHDAHLPDGRAVADVIAADLPPHVPLLDAALEACGTMGVNVEIKSNSAEPGFDEVRSLARPTLATVAAWRGEVILSSFDPVMVDLVRELDAGVPTAQLTFLLQESVEDTVARIVERGHRWWHPYQPVLDAVAVSVAKAAGLGVNAWTVDDPERIATLAGWGVDGIVTNDVPTALRALGRRPSTGS